MIPGGTLEGDVSHGQLVPAAELLYLHGRDVDGARVVRCVELATGTNRFVLDLGPDAGETQVAPCHGGLVVLSGDTLRVYTEPTS